MVSPGPQRRTPAPRCHFSSSPRSDTAAACTSSAASRPRSERQHQRRRHNLHVARRAHGGRSKPWSERAAAPGRLRWNGMWIAFAPEKPAVFTSTNGNNVDIDGVDVHARPVTSRSATASCSNWALWRWTDGTTWVQQSALPRKYRRSTVACWRTAARCADRGARWPRGQHVEMLPDSRP